MVREPIGLSARLIIPLLLYGAGVLLVAMAFVAVRKRTEIALPFSLFCLSAAVYAIFYGLELQSAAEPLILLFNKVQYAGLAGLVIAMMAFALRLSGQWHRVPRYALAVASILPIAAMLGRWTDEWHHWVYRRYSISTWEGLTLMVVEGGWLYTAYLIYLNAVVVVTLSGIARLWGGAHPSLRRHLTLLGLGAFFPWAGHAIYQVFSARGPFLDLSPFGFAAAAFVWADAVFRHGLLDLSPLAMRLVFDSIPQGVLVVDRAGNVLDVNASATRLLDVDEQRLIGRPLSEALAGVKEIMEATKGGTPSGEVSFGEKTFSIRTRPLFSKRGVALGRVVMFEDITAERDRQKQIQQAQKMEAIGRLAGGIAHDFNNLLQAILGFSELAGQEMTPDHSAQTYLKQIDESAWQAAGISDRLLTLSNRRPPNATAIDLAGAVETLLPALREQAGERIEVRYRGPPAQLPPVRLPLALLAQILQNLVANSREAIEARGAIVIEVREVSLDEEYCRTRMDACAGNFVLLSLSDNGRGMSEEVRRHLFEPFFTTKRGAKRAGMGLPIVYGIVHQHGGFVHVYSEEGRGTTVKMYFPAQTKRSEKARSTAGSSLKGQEELVLIVDDEDGIRRYAKSVLERNGYRVETAKSPREALEWAGQTAEAPRVLLTDVIMPEIDGGELSRRLRKKWPELKVIFMSGYSAEFLASQLEGISPVCYLQKPFSSSALASHIRAVLNGAG